MTIVLPALGVAFAAFCVWLMVRIMNRREQWAKRTAVWLAVVPVLYVASFGPWCWAFSRGDGNQDVFVITQSFYTPIFWIWEEGPGPIVDIIGWYANLRWADGVFLYRDPSEGAWLLIRIAP